MAETIQGIPRFGEAPPPRTRRVALRPSATEWLRHATLFALTILTTTFAGIGIAAPNLEPDIPEPSSALGWITFIPEFYFQAVAKLISFTILNPHILVQGVMFSGPLLAILFAHEMGHYIACRRYGVDATLPFFIPAPPLFLAGTVGAFIKVKSPIPTRRPVFYIGVAGPFAVVIMLVHICVVGL